MGAEPLLKAALLGLVEGVTEFIPVSSTGHLILASHWLGANGDAAKTFEIFIQLGAILAIVWLYRERLTHALVAARRDEPSRRLLLNLFVAFLPAALVGFLAHDWIKQRLFTPLVVALALVAGGILILVIERLRPAERTPDVLTVRPPTALGIGLAQVLSLIPGTSRSGATIMGGYALGLSRRAATEFSFFLSIPVMFAATLFDLLKSRGALSAADAPAFVVGFVTAFGSALVVVRGTRLPRTGLGLASGRAVAQRAGSAGDRGTRAAEPPLGTRRRRTAGPPGRGRSHRPQVAQRPDAGRPEDGRHPV
jgi:undecaprenyl-diphosphatase